MTLFLDFDGVLNNQLFLRQRMYSPDQDRMFAPNNIEALCKLCEQLPVKDIIVSSTWKHGRSVEDLRHMLASEGFRYSKLITGKTSDLDGSGADGRAEEIQDWIDSHALQRFVILDDMELGPFFRTGFFKVNAVEGLTPLLVKHIVSSKTGP